MLEEVITKDGGSPNFVQAQKMFRAYMDRGYASLWWLGVTKGPRDFDWNRKTYSEPPVSEVIIQLGLFTGSSCGDNEWLACVDIDDDSVQDAAEVALPPTDMIGGKRSTPRVHRFYRVTGPRPMLSRKWTGPVANGQRSCILELRCANKDGTPTQTIVAPSWHPKGEPVIWESFGVPALITPEALFDACDAIAKIRNATLDGKATAAAARRFLLIPKKSLTANETDEIPDMPDGYTPRQKYHVMSEKEIDNEIRRATSWIRQAEPGSFQSILNTSVYSAATKIAGGVQDGVPCDDYINKLIQACCTLYDLIQETYPETSLDYKKWESTVHRAAQQGKANPRKRPEANTYPKTDAGNAQMLAYEWRDEVRFCTSAGSGNSDNKGYWVYWNGAKWVPTTVDHVCMKASLVWRQAQADILALVQHGETKLSEKQKKELIDDSQFYFKNENRGRTIAAISNLKSWYGHGGLAIDRTTMDANPWLLNCANGVVDFREENPLLVLKDHDRALMMAKASKYTYLGPDAPEPTGFTSAIRRAFQDQPDPDACFNYLMRWFGYFATGDTSAQQLLVIYGTGRNGKSKLIELVGDLLGDYAGTVQKSVLIASERGGSETSHEIAELHGRRFGWFSELSQNDYLNEGRVKQLTGNDRIRARNLYESSFEFNATCKFLIDTNYEPRIRGMEFGILRRIKPLPYTRRIADGEVEPAWKERMLAEEGDLIFTYIINQARIYAKEGLAPEPVCVVEAAEKFKEENDHVGSFLTDNVISADNPSDPRQWIIKAAEPGEEDRVLKAPSGQLYQMYAEWARGGGFSPLNLRNFNAKLIEKGYVDKREASGKVWWGMAIITSGTLAMPPAHPAHEEIERIVTEQVKKQEAAKKAKV